MTDAEFASIVNSTKHAVLSSIQKHLYERFFYAVDDVVQETYIRAYRALAKGKFEGRSKVQTWLYAIARNEALRMNDKMLREERKQAKLARSEFQTYAAYAVTDDSPEEELKTFYSAILSLPSRYASVLKLYWKGRSEEEIASELAISKGTVKSRAFRGRELLRKVVGAPAAAGRAAAGGP